MKSDLGTRSIEQAKTGFLDRKAIQKRLGPIVTAYMVRMGGHVRTTAQRLIRKKNDTRTNRKTKEKVGFTRSDSKPGEPPLSRMGQLREHIYFNYDEASRRMVVGPAKLNKTDGSVPRLHEHGGTVQRRLWLIKDEQGQVIRFRSGGSEAPLVAVTYPKRPFMKPAFDKSIPKSREFWLKAAQKTR